MTGLTPSHGTAARFTSVRAVDIMPTAVEFSGSRESRGLAMSENDNFPTERILSAFSVPNVMLSNRPAPPYRSPWRNYISMGNGWQVREDNLLYASLAWADELPESRARAFVDSWLERWSLTRYRPEERIAIYVGFRGWDRIADWWDRLWT